MTRARIRDGAINRLKDEVYREMFRLEAGHSAADLRLAVALLHAWLAFEDRPPGNAARSWLRQICPVCLDMIEGRRAGALSQRGQGSAPEL